MVFFINEHFIYTGQFHVLRLKNISLYPCVGTSCNIVTIKYNNQIDINVGHSTPN